MMARSGCSRLASSDAPRWRLVSSQEVASFLESRYAKSFNAAQVRQLLHRAREKFSDQLLLTVAHSLKSPELHDVEEELIDLGLHKFCRSALQRWEG